MENAFNSKRSILWLGAVVVLILGFLVAAVILPTTAETPGAGGPDVRVPRMENVPSDHAPKMKLEVEKDEPKE